MENITSNQPEYNPEFADLDVIKTTQFEADGITWYIDRSGSLSVDRNWFLEQFQTWSLLGRDGRSFLETIDNIEKANNQSRPGDVGVHCDNLKKGAFDLMNKHSPVLYLCTLFINEAGEDVGTYTTALGKRKIESWNKARPIIPNDFFLALGFVYLGISAEIWSNIIQTYSGLPNNNPTIPEN